jgi:NAD(P)-dependent dehydrogenase (short-subunit alcohol dehydrogenase family)
MALTRHEESGRTDAALFEGKLALIFGSGRNIGRAIALEFARRGARIAVADLDADGAAETAQLVRDQGGDAQAFDCNVMDDASMHLTAAQVERRMGEADIVMNNAGILHSGYVEDIPVSEWTRMIDCNLLGMVRSLEIFVPKMIARGHGHIVNTGSFAGLYPFAINRIPYAASKAAVISMSQNLALYLMPKGVRVSCLCPGPVMTTSPDGMKVFSKDVVMHGPGSHLYVKSQEDAAAILAEGMCAGRIIIPTHEELWDTLGAWAASPDELIRSTSKAFEGGDKGRPAYDASQFGGPVSGGQA